MMEAWWAKNDENFNLQKTPRPKKKTKSIVLRRRREANEEGNEKQTEDNQ